MADSTIRRAARWLGFIEDPKWDYDDHEDEEELTSPVDAEVVEYETSAPITSLAERRANLPAQPVQPTPRSDQMKVVTVRPRAYNEARTIGEHFRDDVPVIMNLTDMEDAEAKRLVDFAGGLIFGLRGHIERVTSKVFLLSPHNVTVSTEDKERYATGSFFNQS